MTTVNLGGLGQPDETVSGVDVRRRFVRVNGLGVHYLRAGEGPPVVLIHSGMASADSERPLLERLARNHTVFAFDLPGFGDSDPISTSPLQSADLADWLAATLKILNIPACVVAGTHTGAHVALELARRHPEQVSGLVAEGVTDFTPDEAEFYLSEKYLPPFVVKDDGSHLLKVWTMTHDDCVWFPWSIRSPETRMAFARPDAESQQQQLVTRLRSGDGFRATYASVFTHSGGKSIAAQATPMIVMVFDWDPTVAYLDRLPAMKEGQRIEVCPSEAPHIPTKERFVREFTGSGETPPDPPFRPTPGVVNRRYVDIGERQVLLRSAGETQPGKPLLLVHDGRASSRMFEPFMRALMKHRPVYALDLPGTGASASFDQDRPEIADYADAVAQTLEAANIGPCDVYGFGAGAAVALELASNPAFRDAKMVLDTPDFFTASLTRRLMEEWVPPLKPHISGSHLIELWFMLRGEFASWPWFDGSPAGICAAEVPTEWEELNARVTDILRSLDTYNQLTLAALRYDWRAALRRTDRNKITLSITAREPRQKHIAEALEDGGFPDLAVLPADDEGKARRVVERL